MCNEHTTELMHLGLVYMYQYPATPLIYGYIYVLNTIHTLLNAHQQYTYRLDHPCLILY